MAYVAIDSNKQNPMNILRWLIYFSANQHKYSQQIIIRQILKGKNPQQNILAPSQACFSYKISFRSYFQELLKFYVYFILFINQILNSNIKHYNNSKINLPKTVFLINFILFFIIKCEMTFNNKAIAQNRLMNCHHVLSIVQQSIRYILNQTHEAILNKKANKKLPQFILGKLNTSIEQVQSFSIQKNKKQSQKQKIKEVQDFQSNLVDNRSPNSCKSYIVKKSIITNSKQNSRYLPLFSSRSFNSLINGQFSSRKSTISQKNNKNPRQRQKQKPFIKIYTQPNNDQTEYEIQQQMRNQLYSKRQKAEFEKQMNLQNRKKLQNYKKKKQQQTKNLKSFTFNYDSSIIYSKPKIFDLGRETNQNSPIKSSQNQNKDVKFSFQQISQLRSNIKRSILVAKKLQKHQKVVSKPQIITSNPNSLQSNLTKNKSRSYKSQILLNLNPQKSLVQQLRKNNQLQKGVTIRQNYGESRQNYSKEFLEQQQQCNKSLLELSRIQFQKKYQNKKFISKIYKPIKSAILIQKK